MNGPGITRGGNGPAGYQCALSKTAAQLAALGAVATKTYTFGPFPPGCYLLGGYLEVPVGFDAGLSPTITIGTATHPLCCVDAPLIVPIDQTSFFYAGALGGLNPNASVGGDTIVVTVAVGSGNFTNLTTGSLSTVILVSAPLQSQTAT